MVQPLGEVTLLVRDYDEAIAWFTGVLGFELREDSPRGAGGRVAAFSDLYGNRWDLLQLEAR